LDIETENTDMTNPTTFPCDKCSGKGYIRGFEHVAGGRCFRCAGTGLWISRQERDRIVAERRQAEVDAIDGAMAKQQGVSIQDFRDFVGYSGLVPRHPNGYSYTLQEFAEWRKQQNLETAA